MGGCNGKGCYSPVHSQITGLRNVEAGNLLNRSFTYGPSHSGTTDFGPERFAAFSRKLFGIIKEAGRKVGGENDGRSKNRPGQTAAARFVEARFEGVTSIGGKKHSKKQNGE